MEMGLMAHTSLVLRHFEWVPLWHEVFFGCTKHQRLCTSHLGVMLVGFLKRSVYKHLRVNYSHFYTIKGNRPFQASFELLKMPSSQIFVDTAEKSVLNLFCKSDTSETSKKTLAKFYRCLTLIFKFSGYYLMGS